MPPKAFLAAAFTGALVAATAATGAQAASPVSGYIVLLAAGSDAPSVAADHARSYGAAVEFVYTHAIRGYAAKMSATAAQRLRTEGRVLLVQADGVMSTTAQTLPTGINRTDADLSPTAAINGVDTRVNVDVAVIDTGIDLDHPDLNVHAAGAKNCNSGNSANDGNGHGTHVRRLLQLRPGRRPHRPRRVHPVHLER